MKKTVKAFLGFAAIFLSLSSQAWVQSDGVRVTEIIEWEGNTAPIYFRLSNGVMCYIASTDKNTYALLLSMYTMGSSATFHCYDAAETKMAGMQPAHKLHRVWASQ